MKLNKKYIVYILTIILSITYLLVGNRIATKNRTIVNDTGLNPTKAKVIEIIDKTNIEYDMSGGNYGSGVKITFNAKILSGELKGKTVRATQEINTFHPINLKEVEANDSVLLFSNPDTLSEDTWILGEYIRLDALILLGIVFCVFLILFGRIKGVNTILSLLFTCLAIFSVFIPAILSGLNIYFWAINSCIFIILMTLLIVNGANKKSLAAGIGCFSGVIVTGTLTIFVEKVIKLTGMVNDESLYLYQLNETNPIDLKAIIFAAIIIGAIGAIMDVSISISSALLEVYENNMSLTIGALFKSGITIGKDIMGTMANTLVLAYIGSSLSMVLLLAAYNNSLIELLNREMIIVEILQALVGSFGILATIPLTSLVCSMLYVKIKR